MNICRFARRTISAALGCVFPILLANGTTVTNISTGLAAGILTGVLRRGRTRLAERGWRWRKVATLIGHRAYSWPQRVGPRHDAVHPEPSRDAAIRVCSIRYDEQNTWTRRSDGKRDQARHVRDEIMRLSRPTSHRDGIYCSRDGLSIVASAWQVVSWRKPRKTIDILLKWLNHKLENWHIKNVNLVHDCSE